MNRFETISYHIKLPQLDPLSTYNVGNPTFLVQTPCAAYLSGVIVTSHTYDVLLDKFISTSFLIHRTEDGPIVMILQHA